MISFRFNRSRRLLQAKEFSRVFADPVKSANSEFTLLATTNNCQYPRLGLAIAKKRIRLAKDRNRIKRQVRESFRLHQHQLPAIDIVVLARNGLEKIDNRHLAKSLDKHWKTLAKRCKNSSSS